MEIIECFIVFKFIHELFTLGEDFKSQSMMMKYK